MERRINPVPEIIGDDPDATHGDFLDGLVYHLNRVHNKNELDIKVPTKNPTEAAPLENLDNNPQIKDSSI